MRVCVKSERCYYRLSYFEENPLSIFENSSSFGENNSSTLMTKKVISIQNIPDYFNQYLILCLCEFYAIVMVTMIFSMSLWSITRVVVVDIIA